jgi:hypothetical protein
MIVLVAGASYARAALEGPLESQLARIEHEAGVREQL